MFRNAEVRSEGTKGGKDNFKGSLENWKHSERDFMASVSKGGMKRRYLLKWASLILFNVVKRFVVYRRVYLSLVGG